jgi:hypothetical protein
MVTHRRDAQTWVANRRQNMRKTRSGRRMRPKRSRSEQETPSDSPLQSGGSVAYTVNAAAKP